MDSKLSSIKETAADYFSLLVNICTFICSVKAKSTQMSVYVCSPIIGGTYKISQKYMKKSGLFGESMTNASLLKKYEK